MKTSRYLFLFVPLTLLLSVRIYAQKGTSSLPALTKRIELQPSNMTTHELFIDAHGIDVELVAKYDYWVKKFPKEPTIPFAIGRALRGKDDDLSSKFLLTTTRIDSNYAKAWSLLSEIKLTRRHVDSAQICMKNAQKADPGNAEYSFKYAELFEHTDSIKYDSLMQDVVWRHPGNEFASKALYSLAVAYHNDRYADLYFKKLFSMFSAHQNKWFEMGMYSYYDRLFFDEPQKAFDLALAMVLVVKNNRNIWKQNIMNARNLSEARHYLNTANYPAALRSLSEMKIKRNPWINGHLENLEILKACIRDKMGDTKSAYDSLLTIYAQFPTDSLRNYLTKYANKLNYSVQNTNAHIFELRRNMSMHKEITNFNLQNFLTGETFSLADYKDKIVLLTFWFPSCGPCLNEFPHFEKVLKKVNGSDVVYIAVNGGNKNEEMIRSMINDNGYSFIPLRDNGKRIGNLPFISIYPTNYLIGKNNRVIFSDFQIDKKKERTFELMIEEISAYPPFADQPDGNSDNPYKMSE